jgi:murein DD-endopeptidase MepM/ murein hydrolase activator NlpD
MPEGSCSPAGAPTASRSRSHHGNGFHTIYGHMSAALVTTGQLVTQGQQIGLMGATGRATGPHLHFEIRFQGVPQNPIDLLS